jgi:hypothetical protein
LLLPELQRRAFEIKLSADQLIISELMSMVSPTTLYVLKPEQLIELESRVPAWAHDTLDESASDIQGQIPTIGFF